MKRKRIISFRKSDWERKEYSDEEKAAHLKYSRRKVAPLHGTPETDKPVLDSIPLPPGRSKRRFLQEARLIGRAMQDRLFSTGMMFSLSVKKPLLTQMSLLQNSCDFLMKICTHPEQHLPLLATLSPNIVAEPVGPGISPEDALGLLLMPFNDLIGGIKSLGELAQHANQSLSSPSKVKRYEIEIEATEKLHDLWVEAIQPDARGRGYSRDAFSGFVDILLGQYDRFERETAKFTRSTKSVWAQPERRQMRTRKTELFRRRS